MDMPGIVMARKGRGAASNETGRFESERRVAFDDGWDRVDEDPAPRLETRLSVDATRTIIARNDSPDIGFDRSINPYRGCEHGCIYCYARPSHAYLGLSPGLDFETRIFYKPRAAALLAAELRDKGYKCRPIALGSNTDPYQPSERRLGITRAILEVLRDFRHPVTIVTKGVLIQRDVDILAEMARDNLAVVTVSVTTLDRELARRMEPRAATPERRLETIAALAGAGVPTGVLAAPMIPALNDSEMESILNTRARPAPRSPATRYCGCRSN
jgi:DNA repair photolyase